MSKELKYQWARGDHAGKEEIFDKEEGEWIIFKSGRRINSELINEFMVLVDHNGPMDVSPTGGVTTVNFVQDDDNYSHAMAAEKSIHPRDLLGNNQQQNTQQNQTFVQQPEPKKEINPIKLLINQSAKDEIEIDIKYKLKLPKKGVYNIIKDSFEVDIDAEILDTVKSELDVNAIKKLFEEQILERIKLHYKQ